MYNFNIPTWGWGYSEWRGDESKLISFEKIINKAGDKYIGEKGEFIIINGEDIEIYEFKFGKFKKIEGKGI